MNTKSPHLQPKLVQNFHLLTTFYLYSNLVSMLPTDYSNWQKEEDIDILTQFAIEAALTSDWNEATKINQKILEASKDNIEALNRLAKAQCSQGEIVKAQKTYKKVLEIDPYNIIAQKNLEKLSKVTEPKNGNSNHNGNEKTKTPNLSTVFLFEPGKTKVINLLNLAPPCVLAILNCGDRVEMNLKKHSICITTSDGTYLGALPDDLSHKLLTYIAGGNQYEAYIKYATIKMLTVYIKEVKRSQRFINQPSFQEKRKLQDLKELSFI